jgi:hypothetical protein
VLYWLWRLGLVRFASKGRNNNLYFKKFIKFILFKHPPKEGIINILQPPASLPHALHPAKPLALPSIGLTLSPAKQG